MARNEHGEGVLAALLDDVIAAEEPSAELLARYADDPASLTPELRAELEAQIERSPALADQVRLLKRFELPQEDPEIVPERGLGARLRDWLDAHFAIGNSGWWAPVAAAAALVVAAIVIATREDPPLVAHVPVVPVENPIEEVQPISAPLPEPVAPRPAPERLALLEPGEPADAEEIAGQEPNGREANVPPHYTVPADALAMSGTWRTGIVTRSASAALPTPTLLTPSHVGRTVREGPRLFWYLPEKTDHPLAISVVAEQGGSTLLEVALDGPHAAGFDSLDLSQRGAALAYGTTYEWFVAVRAGGETSARDTTASSAIERVEESPELATELERAGAAGAAQVYAKYGIWYDALAALSAQIERAPRNETLRLQRAALLTQVGLPEPAAFDREAAGQ